MALSAGAGLLGASSANRAGRQARTFEAKQAADARRRLGFLQLGPTDYLDYLTATNDITGRQRAGMRPRATSQEIAEAQGRFFGRYRPYEDELRDANAGYIGDLEENRVTEERRTADLDRMAATNEGAGSDLEANEIARIRRDSAKRLKGLNQTTNAQLGQFGLSTLKSNQAEANTRLTGEAENDAILRARLAALDRFQRARQARIGLNLGRYSLNGEIERSLAGARRGAALEPVQSRMALFEGPAFGALQAPPGSFPGQSGLGSALGSVASGLTTLGGALAFGGGGSGSAGQAAAGGVAAPWNSDYLNAWLR